MEAGFTAKFEPERGRLVPSENSQRAATRKKILRELSLRRCSFFRLNI
jgi:hypothetical protein